MEVVLPVNMLNKRYFAEMGAMEYIDINLIDNVRCHVIPSVL
jgi:hypothetical protein